MGSVLVSIAFGCGCAALLATQGKGWVTPLLFAITMFVPAWAMCTDPPPPPRRRRH